MSVSFRLKLKEKVFELKAEPDDTLWAVKERMAGELEIESSFQKWIYKGRVLSNEQTVTGANIINEDTIIVMKATTASAPPAGAPATSAAASVAASGATAASSSSVPAPAVASPASPMVQTPQFNMAMHQLLSNDESVAKSSVELLLKVATNIVNNPMEEKYRRMRSSNATFSAKLGNVNGGNACMQALGFDLVGDDWILTPTAEKWTNLVACQAKLTNFSQRMNATANSAVPASPPRASSLPVASSGESQPGSGPGEKASETDAQQQVLLMAMMQSVMMNKNEDGAIERTSETHETEKPKEDGEASGSNEKET